MSQLSEIEQLRKDRDSLLLMLSDYAFHHDAAIKGRCGNVIPPGIVRLVKARYDEVTVLRERLSLDEINIWREDDEPA